MQRSVAMETSRGWRIAKEKVGHKIDVVVALSMAALGAVQEGQSGLPAGLVSEVDAEQRRRADRPRMVGNTVELAGMTFEAPPADRLEAGRQLDSLARSYQAEHGGTYAEAFKMVAAEKSCIASQLRECDG